MISGVWLPIVTPFVDGGVDFAASSRPLLFREANPMPIRPSQMSSIGH